jgi:serine protease Do
VGFHSIPEVKAMTQPAQTLKGLVLMVACCCFLASSLLAQERSGNETHVARYFDSVIEQAQPKMAKVFGASVGNVEGNATGILVSDEGHILTIQGVYLDGRNVRVIMSDGAEYPATVLKRDRQTQLALLKIEAKTPNFFQLSTESVGQQGDWIVALTNAFRVADKDEPVSAMWGIISLRTSIEARLNQRDFAYQGEMVVVDCITSNPGAGGGAVITADGRLVGMVGRIIDSSETNTRLNYAVPSSVLAKFVSGDESQKTSSEKNDFREKAELGIVLFKMGGRNSPAYVDRTFPGSPAAAANLQADDLIVSISGQKIGNIKQYEAILAMLKPDEEVILVVKRGDSILRIPIVPVRRK